MRYCFFKAKILNAIINNKAVGKNKSHPRSDAGVALPVNFFYFISFSSFIILEPPPSLSIHQST